MRFDDPSLRDPNCPVVFKQQIQQANVYSMMNNQQPVYNADRVSRDSVLDEILSSLYLSLPPDVYEEYKDTILQCVYENQQRHSIVEMGCEVDEDDNLKMVDLFIDSKRVEGLSENTLKSYKYNILRVLDFLNKNWIDITSADIRFFLSQYKRTGVSNTSINNMRSILSSFYGWLESEDYILKSPMRRIHKIKMQKVVKEVITEENIELLRLACKNYRDLAMIDTLFSTGVRLSELQQMDVEDINFDKHSCVVLGKGNKEREVYLNAKSRVNLRRYISSRNDSNPALWVQIKQPHDRLSNRGIQEILQKIQDDANINQSIHPHMFRRTAATMALQRGMAIETIQMMLGHNSIDTTMRYAMVNTESVKAAHERFMS